MTSPKRNAPEALCRGVSEFVIAGRRDDPEITTQPENFKQTERNRRRRVSKFAHEIAAEEFGFHRHFAWKQWGEFRDTTPAELAKRRAS